MKCPKCGSEVPNGAIACQRCKSFINNVYGDRKNNKSNENGFGFGLLVKIIGVMCLGLLLLTVLIVITAPRNTTSDVATQENSAPVENINTTTFHEEDSVEKEFKVSEEVQRTNIPIEEEVAFSDALSSELTSEVAQKAIDILMNQIGFTELEYLGRNPMGTGNYDINADGYEIVLTASDDVYRIFIPGSSYTFFEDGEVKITVAALESKSIDQYEKDAYYIIAKSIIEKSLKDPSSADFPSMFTEPESIAMVKNDNLVAVQSYVEANNSFGQSVKTMYTVQFTVINLENWEYEVNYLNIGGEVVGDYTEME